MKIKHTFDKPFYSFDWQGCMVSVHNVIAGLLISLVLQCRFFFLHSFILSFFSPFDPSCVFEPNTKIYLSAIFGKCKRVYPMAIWTSAKCNDELMEWMSSFSWHTKQQFSVDCGDLATHHIQHSTLEHFAIECALLLLLISSSLLLSVCFSAIAYIVGRTNSSGVCVRRMNFTKNEWMQLRQKKRRKRK